ncbi:MAG TPA: serine protease [Burkholderiales bacterium]|jgi:S1-C subfamily serine protease|nr:serine protease [Burkholderiales bacterium]
MHVEAKTLLSLLSRATLTVFLLACASAWADPGRAQVLKVAPSLARVEAKKTSGGYAFGTAVAIAPDRVVTNCHVTREAQAIYLVKGGLRWDVRAQLADVDHDVCLLWVPGMDARVVLLAASASLRVGQPVTAIGYGGATGIQVSIGDVTGLHALDGGQVIRSSAAFSGGASGGGLFDEDGRLVGILSFRLPAKGAYFFSIPVEWFRERVLDLSSYQPVAPLGEARSFWERPQAEQPYFMRATSLEAAQNWPELLRLTDAWVEAEPGNPDPQNFRDKALSAPANGYREFQ